MSTNAAILGPGTPAPEFDLRSSNKSRAKLSDFRGKPLIIAFYPNDFSPVCGDEIALFNEVYPEFQKLGAEIVGISVDSMWCHIAFAASKKLRFPLLADFEPKGEISRAFGAYRERDGTSERALFVLDSNGIIAWSYLSPVDVNPGADGILNALEKLRASGGTASASRSETVMDAEARA